VVRCLYGEEVEPVSEEISARRELDAGLLEAMYNLAGGDESAYRVRKEGSERRAEILAQAGAREAMVSAPSPVRASEPHRRAVNTEK